MTHFTKPSQTPRTQDRSLVHYGTLHPWTEEDIDQLRLDFLRGLPIKLIARGMARTPTAVNKALSRFCIRTPRLLRESRTKEFRKPKRVNTREKAILESIQWTPFSEVLAWLDQQGHIVDRHGEAFIIVRRPYTPLQLVLFANRLRTEQGLDIFLVENLTW